MWGASPSTSFKSLSAPLPPAFLGLGSARDLGWGHPGAQVHSVVPGGAGRGPRGPDRRAEERGGCWWKSFQGGTLKGLGIGQGWEPKSPRALQGRPSKPLLLTRRGYEAARGGGDPLLMTFAPGLRLQLLAGPPLGPSPKPGA